jgi:adenylate cyclase
VEHGDHRWEVDVFHEYLEGLVLAELEVQRVGEAFLIPRWVGKDVSDDKRYTNKRLSIKQRIPNPHKYED